MIEELKNAVNWHKDTNYYLSPELREDRKDSVWYNDCVYSFVYKGYRLSVIPCGDIAFFYKDEYYKNGLYDTDLKNDDDLIKNIKNDEFLFVNNNWYTLFVDKIDENGNEIEIDNFVIDNITDCLDKEWVENIVKGL